MIKTLGKLFVMHFRAFRKRGAWSDMKSMILILIFLAVIIGIMVVIFKLAKHNQEVGRKGFLSFLGMGK